MEQQGALARSVGTDQRDGLALSNGEIHSPQRPSAVGVLVFKSLGKDRWGGLGVSVVLHGMTVFGSIKPSEMTVPSSRQHRLVNTLAAFD